VRLSHDPGKAHASFDDPNLVSQAGLVPVMALAERAGLAALVREHVSVSGPCGASAGLKIGCLVAGMAAGADSIEDLDVLRHGAMGELFGGIRAPSTLGSFLRSFTWGNVRQVDAVSRRLLAELAARAPLLPGGDVLAFIDMDSTQKRVYGHQKQGAGFGHTKIRGRSLLVRGLNALAAVISTPLAAPVIAAARLRGGTAHSARGAASLAAEAITAARLAGCAGLLLFRIDSAYYSAAVLAAIRAGGASFSVTVPMHCKVRAAIVSVSEDAWTPVVYPRAVWDEDQGRLISDAQVAEIPYTAFTSKKKSQAITARLIIRRVRDLNATAPRGQGELFTAWRYHAVFTDSPFETVQAEAQHRDHAIIEQVFADLNDGPLAHLPSGHFPANAAWLTCATICHNLTRAAGTLAGPVHAKARGATIRRHLIAVAARTARHGRGHITIHLPDGWHHEHHWMNLFEAACGPPPPRPDQPPGHRTPARPQRPPIPAPAAPPGQAAEHASGKNTTPPEHHQNHWRLRRDRNRTQNSGGGSRLSPRRKQGARMAARRGRKTSSGSGWLPVCVLAGIVLLITAAITHALAALILLAAAIGGVLALRWHAAGQRAAAIEGHRRWLHEASFLAAANAMSGTQFELYVADLMRITGGRDVVHTGGPGDGGADVLAVEPSGRPVAMQCKRQLSTVPVGVIRELAGTLAHEHPGRYGVLVTTALLTKPAAELASRAGITVIDRNGLAGWMASARQILEQQAAAPVSAGRPVPEQPTWPG
jgi:hypothetical protein